MENLAVSHNFGPAVKISPKPGETVLTVTVLVLISHFREVFDDILNIVS